MVGLIVILFYAFKLAFLAWLACVRTKEFSLKSEDKKAYLHAHKIIIIMPVIMKEVYTVDKMYSNYAFFFCWIAIYPLDKVICSLNNKGLDAGVIFYN